MKKSIMILLIMVILLQAFLIQESFAKSKFNKELFEKLAESKNKVPHVDIPNYERVKLDNGLTIYLVEDHTLPIIEVVGYIKGGRRQETENVAGISDLMFTMMNTSTQNFEEEEFSKYKELHGIDFSFSVKNDYTKFSGDALSIDKKDMISLMADLFQNPKFNADYFSRIKQQTLQSLLQAKTQESSLLNMYFYKTIYHNHPYSFQYDLDLRRKALANITPASLKEFYNQNITPNNTILGIVGDIDISKMKQLIKAEFKNWPQDKINLKKSKLKVDGKNYNKVIIINKPDATQAKIKMGYSFFSDEFQSRIPFTIANRVYGGGDFGSRLMKNLRVKKGYVYGVHSNDSYDQLDGDYYITTEVKPNKTYETMEAIKEEMLAIKSGKAKITDEELFKIINRYNALYPKKYKSKLNILSKVIYNVEIKNRKASYMNKFIKKYNGLTVEEAQKSFAKYTYPEKFLTVIVGNKEKLIPEFKKKGIKIKVIEIN